VAAGCASATVFIPVATPGVHAAGDLFRTDGTVLLPLVPLPGLAPAGLPDLAAVVAQLLALLAERAMA
jgi:formylmethanofuran dehydrogenase subunit B